MTIQKNIEDKTLTMALNGRLDTTSTPEFESELKASLDDINKLVLDFADLEYISSSGLRALLFAQKTMNKQGEMLVCNVNSVIADIFEVTGFLNILTIQ